MNNKVAFIIAIVIISILAGFILNNDSDISVAENGEYCTLDEVAAYIKEFHKLPSNYITKSEAHSLGWSGGPLKEYAPGKSIGGDIFTNRQHILPDSDYEYIECDINANGTSRGSERIVYNTGNYKVYYTPNHYNSFVEI